MAPNLKPANLLLIAVSTGLFLCGSVLGLTLRAAGVNSWSKFSALASEAVFGAPVKNIRFAFDRDLLGEASLRSRSNAALPAPLIANSSLELLNDFAPDSRYRKLVTNAGVLRLDLVVEIDGIEQLSPCTAFLIDSDKLLMAGHCLAPAKRSGDLLDGALRVGYYSDAVEGANIQPKLEILEEGAKREKHLDYAIVKIDAAASSMLKENGFRPARMTRDIQAEQDLLVIHHPLGDVLHLSRRNCRMAGRASDAANSEYFDHSCGTLPGTSGAPIFDDQSLSVVGVHVRGDPNVIQINRTDGSGLSMLALMESSPIVKAIAEGGTSDD